MVIPLCPTYDFKNKIFSVHKLKKKNKIQNNLEQALPTENRYYIFTL